MSVRIIEGDCRDVLRTLPDASVHCCVTSPPYFGLRDYGVDGQMGLEATPDAFITGMVAVFREVRRVLRDDGTLWLNIGDSYAGSWGAQGHGPSNTSAMARHAVNNHPKRAQQTGSIRAAGVKPKDLYGIPWMLAFALRADGWYLRQDIIWSKPNPMPESVRDRCTKAHEYLFLFSKSARYFYDADAIAEPTDWDSSNTKMPDGWDTGEGGHGSFHRNGREKGRGGVNAFRGQGSNRDAGNGQANRDGRDMRDVGIGGTRNKRSVWEIATAPFKEAHFATFPPALVEPCIKAGCPIDGTVLDPFFGAGTMGLVADRLQRNCIGIELSSDYAAIARKRISGDAPLFAELSA